VIDSVERVRRAIADHRPVTRTPAREGHNGIEPTGPTQVECSCGAGLRRTREART
jgi:hypothetical protein